MKALIYSKPNCPWCDRAKELLAEYNIEYEERDVSLAPYKQELLLRVPDARTVPQIFINDVYIGGYSDLLEYAV